MVEHQQQVNSTGPAVSDSNPQQYGANGGIGVTTSINGTATGFAGGGGGGSYSEPGSGEGNHNWPNGKAAGGGTGSRLCQQFWWR